MDIASLRKIGPYEVVRFVDAGAFAWVFEVTDPKFAGRRLALKMLKPEAAQGEELRRFESEARLLAQIDHPSVVTIFDFGRDETTGNFFYVMNFVDGPTLRQRLKEGPLSFEEALPIFVDLLDGLARIHELGIVHRDIKPANVLIGSDGRARLADLGIARVQAERGQTRTGVAVGTALYMSPEQARGRQVDARSDLFSLGLTLYEVLTGDVVYDHVESVDSSSGMDVLMYIGSLVHTRSEFEVRFDESAAVPLPIQKLILRALRLSPDARFADAIEMRDALRAALRDTPRAAAHGAIATRHLAGAGAGLAVLLLALAFYFFQYAPQQRGIALRAEAERRLAELNEIAVLATTAISGSQDLQPGPAADLTRAVDEKLLRADAYLKDGAADLQAGSYELALANLERGGAQHDVACQLMVDEFLTPRAAGDQQRLYEQAIRLSDRGAQEVAPEAWGGLKARLDAASASLDARTGCAAAVFQLERVEAAQAGVAQAAAVQAAMAEAWPALLAEAYEKALTARLVASAEPTDAIEYRAELKRAKRLLVQGARHAEKDDPLNARDAYRAAERAFITASEIAPAALAGAAASEMAERVAREVEVSPAIVAELETGRAAYAAAQWSSASAAFGRAIEALKEQRAANEWRREAIRAQKIAQIARADALREGAEKSARIDFAEGESTLARAETALAGNQAKEAETGFGEARDFYRTARKRAIQALRDAGLKRASVVQAGERLFGRGGCSDLASEEARSHCEAADASLAAGTAAIEALDAPAALRSFYAALEGYARGSSAQVLWQATRPRPPELVRRVPQRAVVRLAPGQLARFVVEASDPNGDVLAYEWRLDGAVQQEDGPSLKRRLEGSTAVRVEVSDGKGGVLVEEWTVEVVRSQL